MGDKEVVEAAAYTTPGPSADDEDEDVRANNFYSSLFPKPIYYVVFCRVCGGQLLQGEQQQQPKQFIGTIR